MSTNETATQKELYLASYEWDVYTRQCKDCDDFIYQIDDYDDPNNGGPWMQKQCPVCYDGPVVEFEPKLLDGPVVPFVSTHISADATHDESCLPPWLKRPVVV